MSLPEIVSREEWIAKRRELLAKEKQQTAERDALNADRRRLPMVEISEPYVFEGPEGPVGLVDLFKGYRQLALQHFMFDPSWDEGCESCTASIEEFSEGWLRHLRARQTNFAVVSRAPLEKLLAYKENHGWTIDWYSSFGSEFNYDFNVTIDASKRPVMFNFRDADELSRAGFEWLLDPAGHPSEQPGMSVFLRDGDRVFHTYSTYGRGMESLGGAYSCLDLTALGRQEEWEEPKGRVDDARPSMPNFAE